MRQGLVVVAAAALLVIGVALARDTGPLLALRWWLQTSLERHSRVASVHVDGVGDVKMFLDPDDDVMTPWIQQHGSWEDNETYWFTKSVGPGDVIVDAGANTGYYTLLGAKLVGEAGRVYAFEPDPANFALLEKNVRVNGLTNVVAEQKALSDEPGTIELFLAEHNKGDHRIFASRDEVRPSIEIEAVTLDDYFAGRENDIDFVKIDTQGAEGAIVEGMAGILAKNDHMRMVVEYSPAHLEEFGFSPEELVRRLEAADFRFFDIALGGSERLPLKPVTPASLRGVTADTKGFTNLLLVKGRAELERLEEALRASQAALAAGGPEMARAREAWEASLLRDLESDPWTEVKATVRPGPDGGEKLVLLPLGEPGVTGLQIVYAPARGARPAAARARARVSIELGRPAARAAAPAPVAIADAAGDGGMSPLPRPPAGGGERAGRDDLLHDGDSGPGDAKAEGAVAPAGSERTVQVDPTAPGAVVLAFAAPLVEAGDLEVRIGPGLPAGDLRFFVTRARSPLPPRVLEALRTPPSERTRAQQRIVDLNFRARSPHLAAARERVRASRAAVDAHQDLERAGR